MVLTVNPTAELFAVIDTQLSEASERKVPIAWWVGPSNPMPDLAKGLEDRGLFQVAELTGMAVGWSRGESLPECGGRKTWPGRQGSHSGGTL